MQINFLTCQFKGARFVNFYYNFSPNNKLTNGKYCAKNGSPAFQGVFILDYERKAKESLGLCYLYIRAGVETLSRELINLNLRMARANAAHANPFYSELHVTFR